MERGGHVKSLYRRPGSRHENRPRHSLPDREAASRRGYGVDPGPLESLASWEVPFVYVDLGLLPPDTFQPMILPAIRENVVGELRGFLESCQYCCHLQRTPQTEQSVAALVDEVLRHPSGLLNLSEMRRYDEYLLSHSLGVCLLSVITGANLEWSRPALALLGLAALLHDVGKVRVPQAILMKPGPLDAREWLEVRTPPCTPSISCARNPASWRPPPSTTKT